MAIPMTERTLSLCAGCLDGCNYGRGCELFHGYRYKNRKMVFKMAGRDDKKYFKEFWEKNRERELEKRKRWARENVCKTYATHSFHNYMKVNKLSAPENCSHCGKMGRIIAHHPDYTDPFNVIWLCNGCHKRVHNGSLAL